MSRRARSRLWGSDKLIRNFRFGPLARTSYASPALDTTNLPLEKAPALVVAVIGLAYAQTRPEKLSAVVSRYQLVPATVTYEGKDGHQAEGPELFLVDTESGHVWKYEFSRAPRSDEKVRFPDYFASVPVDGLHGWDVLERMQQFYERLDKSKKNQQQP